ncbi:MAG: hypothetical protein MSC30_14285 [Gaiellaceae bacterium MAG52_C11]|nr:hypothetical protein [Candidatus Gaiellasilicea maunaloa]
MSSSLIARFDEDRSQGHTREEARANVIDALRGILELRFGEHRRSSRCASSEVRS